MEEKIILHVEDDEEQAILLGEALRLNGVTAEVRRARDGEEALRILSACNGSNKAWPAVVLLDLNMPKMNGFDVLRHIRSQDDTRILPVVVLSSSTREEDVRNAYLLGANSYVRKFTSFPELSAAVRVLVSYWLGLNELAPATGGPEGALQT